jgi:hypothetical protein
MDALEQSSSSSSSEDGRAVLATAAASRCSLAGPSSSRLRYTHSTPLHSTHLINPRGSPVPFTVLSISISISVSDAALGSVQDRDTKFQGTHLHLRLHHRPHHRPHQRVRRQGQRGKAIDARQWRAPHWDAQDTAGDRRQAQAPARPASVPNGACQSDPIPTLNLNLLLCQKEPSTCPRRVSGACSRR